MESQATTDAAPTQTASRWAGYSVEDDLEISVTYPVKQGEGMGAYMLYKLNTKASPEEND